MPKRRRTPSPPSVSPGEPADIADTLDEIAYDEEVRRKSREAGTEEQDQEEFRSFMERVKAADFKDDDEDESSEWTSEQQAYFKAWLEEHRASVRGYDVPTNLGATSDTLALLQVTIQTVEEQTLLTHPEAQPVLRHAREMLHVARAFVMEGRSYFEPETPNLKAPNQRVEQEGRLRVVNAARDYIWATQGHESVGHDRPITKQKEAQRLVKITLEAMEDMPKVAPLFMLATAVINVLFWWRKGFKSTQTTAPSYVPPIAALLCDLPTPPHDEVIAAIHRAASAMYKSPGGPRGAEAIRRAFIIGLTLFGVPTRDAHNCFRP
jgi:hypothetical protein